MSEDVKDIGATDGIAKSILGQVTTKLDEVATDQEVADIIREQLSLDATPQETEVAIDALLQLAQNRCMAEGEQDND